MNDIRLFVTKDEMRKARDDLGRPAGLDESIVATGIDAFFVLLDGGTVEIEGKQHRLVEIGDTDG